METNFSQRDRDGCVNLIREVAFSKSSYNLFTFKRPSPESKDVVVILMEDVADSEYLLIPSQLSRFCFHEGKVRALDTIHIELKLQTLY